MINIRIISILIISTAAWFSSYASAATQWPAALMYRDKPIEPVCVVATQSGDSSRLEPKAVNCREQVSDDDYVKEIKYETVFDKKNNRVTFEAEYAYQDPQFSRKFITNEEYQYIGTINDKLLVLTQYYSTDGTGRFAALGLIKRKGDFLINAGEITAGDRFQGGIIDIDSLVDGVLRYRSVTTPLDLMDSISSRRQKNVWQKLPRSAISYGGSLLYEVDLKKSDIKPKLYGIGFAEADNYNETYAGNNQEACFSQIAHANVISGKTTLDLKAAQAFQNDVVDCIGARV